MYDSQGGITYVLSNPAAKTVVALPAFPNSYLYAFSMSTAIQSGTGIFANTSGVITYAGRSITDTTSASSTVFGGHVQLVLQVDA